MRGGTTMACGHSARGLAAAHRAPHPEGPGLVARRHHHAAADDHRPAPERGVVALLDRGEERVEVGVEDRRSSGRRAALDTNTCSHPRTRAAVGRVRSRASASRSQVAAVTPRLRSSCLRTRIDASVRGQVVDHLHVAGQHEPRHARLEEREQRAGIERPRDRRRSRRRSRRPRRAARARRSPRTRARRGARRRASRPRTTRCSRPGGGWCRAGGRRSSTSRRRRAGTRRRCGTTRCATRPRSAPASCGSRRSAPTARRCARPAPPPRRRAPARRARRRCAPRATGSPRGCDRSSAHGPWSQPVVTAMPVSVWPYPVPTRTPKRRSKSLDLGDHRAEDHVAQRRVGVVVVGLAPT